MKRLARVLFLVCFCFLFLGMAGGPDKDTIKVPEPAALFRVTLVDQADVSTELSKFSCEGQTFFMGRHGRMEISVEFAKIREVRFFSQEPMVRAEIVLKDGQTLSLLMKPSRPCYGVSRWGNVRIEIRDIKLLAISNPAAPVKR